MVSHPETSSDPPIGSDRESGRDRTAAGLVCRLWMWHSSAKTRKKKGRRGLRL